MKIKKVSKSQYINQNLPQVNDLFVTIQQNENQVPYLISTLPNSKYCLIHLTSGNINYSDTTIENLINNYIKSQKNKPNPTIEYFFAKHSDVKIKINKTFGYTKINT